MTGNELKNYRYQCPPMGNRVRRGPRNDCMSQLELAALIGVHRNTVSLWETRGDEEIPKWVPCALIGVETMIKAHAEEIKAHEDQVRQMEKHGVDRGLERRTTAELNTTEDVR